MRNALDGGLSAGRAGLAILARIPGRPASGTSVTRQYACLMHCIAPTPSCTANPAASSTNSTRFLRSNEYFRYSAKLVQCNNRVYARVCTRGRADVAVRPYRPRPFSQRPSPISPTARQRGPGWRRCLTPMALAVPAWVRPMQRGRVSDLPCARHLPCARSTYREGKHRNGNIR